jgi:hypothetical protein
MDQRERYPDEAEETRLALEWLQSRLWTALPCVVQAFPSASGLGPMILDAQPTISGSYLNSKGVQVQLQMPLLINIPVEFPGGGGVTLTFPINPGDECLVTFSARCIDAWWLLGAGPSNAPGRAPPDQRMHDLSDGIARVGIRSKPRSYVVPTNSAQLRTDDGKAILAINPTNYNITCATQTGDIDVTANAGQVSINAANNAVINGVTIDSNGNVNAPGTITGKDVLNAAGTSLTSHTTSNVQPGTGISGAPVPGS